MGLYKSLGIVLLSVAALAAKSSGSLFELRGVTGAPSAASEKMTFTAADQQPQTIAVQKRPLLDLGSVESAAAVGNTLEITLTPAGRLRFAQAATPRMAIVLEGKVREILNQSEFKGTVIKVHGLSPVEAAAFAAKINAATNK